jgi:hypothetical protein
LVGRGGLADAVVLRNETGDEWPRATIHVANMAAVDRRDRDERA